MGEVNQLDIPDGTGIRVAVARARYNDHITSGLLAGAVEYLTAANVHHDVFEAPGAFELPLVAAELAARAYDAVVVLGAVVNGDTDHYEHVAGRASEGLMQVALETRKPIAFGILTVQEEEQALVRSRPGTDNKGTEAAAAAVETVLLMRKIAGLR
ncbi:MAG: 6,7-dimethyl-8-ribityllumazine synthase [bacterium]|nr:6,7-dimethyl-8-ribityllumazine synthase [bacterium]